MTVTEGIREGQDFRDCGEGGGGGRGFLLPGILPRPLALCNSVPINTRHSRDSSLHAPPAELARLTSLKIASLRLGEVRLKT